jgi:hypothetical protein
MRGFPVHLFDPAPLRSELNAIARYSMQPSAAEIDAAHEEDIALQDGQDPRSRFAEVLEGVPQ